MWTYRLSPDTRVNRMRVPHQGPEEEGAPGQRRVSLPLKEQRGEAGRRGVTGKTLGPGEDRVGTL